MAKICWHWWKLRFCNRCQFLTCKKIFLKFSAHIIWCCKHPDFKFERNFFFQYVKNILKNRTQPCFWKYFLHDDKNCLHSNLNCQIWVLTNPKKIFLQGKNWQRLKNCNFHQRQHIFAVARWNHPLCLPYNRFLLNLSEICLQNTLSLSVTDLENLTFWSPLKRASPHRVVKTCLWFRKHNSW